MWSCVESWAVIDAYACYTKNGGRSGGRRFAVLAQPISPSEAARHLKAYSIRSPAAFKQIGSRLIGETSGDVDQIIPAFLDAIAFVKSTPVITDGRAPSERRGNQ